jgi:F-type H+-transporting ATPase subunit delta
MNDRLAANRYAQAAFEIAHAERRDQEIEDELGSLSASLKANPALEKKLLSPNLSLAGKKAVAAALYAGSPNKKIMTGILSVIFEKGRFSLIHDVAEAYKRISDLSQGEGLAEITTAVPLDAAKEKEMTACLEALAGCKLVVQKTVDPSLIGGVKVKIRNKVYDGSVRGNLDRLQKELTNIKSV